MPDNLPTVSVIIPARDAVDSLSLALKAVSTQTYPNIVDVVVAAADTPTAEVARLNGAAVVDNPAGTTPAGLNLAIAASSGEVIVRCDARSLLPPEYVSDAVATLLRTGAATVGGMQVPIGNTEWARAIAAAMSSRWGAGDARYRIGGHEGPVETVYLGVFRRSTVAEVGGFDESFARTQDYELNHRLLAAGEVVWFDPSLKVAYQPRGTLGSLAGQYFDYGRAKRQFGRAHRGSLRWRQLAAPALVTGQVAAVVGSFWAPLLLTIPGLYGVGLIVAGIASRERSLRVSAALAVMHLSWGAGFLIGPAKGD